MALQASENFGKGRASDRGFELELAPTETENRGRKGESDES